MRVRLPNVLREMGAALVIVCALVLATGLFGLWFGDHTRLRWAGIGIHFVYAIMIWPALYLVVSGAICLAVRRWGHVVGEAQRRLELQRGLILLASGLVGIAGMRWLF